MKQRFMVEFECERKVLHTEIQAAIVKQFEVWPVTATQQPDPPAPEKKCNCISGRSQSTNGCPIHGCTY